MTTTTTRIGLINRIAASYDARQYAMIRDELEPLGDEYLLLESDLGYYYSAALLRTGASEDALDLMRRLELVGELKGNINLYNRTKALEAVAHIERGDLDLAGDILSDLLRRLDPVEQAFLTAVATNNAGVISNIRGDWDSALANFNRATAFFHLIGDSQSYALGQHNIAMAYRHLGFLHAAESHFSLALTHAQESGIEEVVVSVETERALLLSQTGDSKLALSNVQRVIERAKQLRNPLIEAEALRVAGTIFVREGKWVEGSKHLELALELGGRMQIRLLQAECLEELAALAQQMGNHEQSRAVGTKAALIYREMGAATRAIGLRERLGIQASR